MIDWLLKKADLNLDWWLLVPTIPLIGFGLVTMNSFTGQSYYFNRQLSWVLFSYALALLLACIDWRFLRKSWVLVGLYLPVLLILILLFVVGHISNGAQSWLSLGGFSLQPADFMKIILILILAKYFSKRHIEIANIRHIIVSGVYALIPLLAILFQPDLGSAMIIFLIWLGMVLVSGISKKHLLLVFGAVFLVSAVAWFAVLAPYQKDRIKTFIYPLADIHKTGYNAFQSTVVVGSGGWFGKGVGYGTQSRLKFLPEYQTDFIFSAYAEEWGFFGVLILFSLFGLIIWRILANAMMGASNFEILFGLGLAIMLLSHFIIHVGMNIGILPVTGLPMPFMSYGGSHLFAEFLGLGILLGMRRYSLAFHRDDVKNEFIGPQ
ncbi:MAG: FtsW/RodA/SpoVE family cell cycle protein [Candidatus Vogelbacteria bacterium]|nr:FtsW/RodA/SpoVE family cell cycle protein [Candidatus Vogelbacteria bacterium]